MRAWIIDSEAVCFGEDCFDFHALRSRDGGKAADLIAFDLLAYGGEDWRAEPLEHRRAWLEGILAALVDGLLFSAAIVGDGSEVFAEACGMGLEGIVSKRLGSRYRSGKCDDWRKIKNQGYSRS